eukprot:1097666-Lingulodinium_polyedra.AAC.1
MSEEDSLEAVVDPGAVRCLIGARALQQVARAMHAQGLRPLRLGRSPPPARGVGGQAHMLGLAVVPICLGGITAVA